VLHSWHHLYCRKWRHSCIRSMFLCLMLAIRAWFSSAVLIWVLCRSLFWFVWAALFRFLWTTREFKREKFVIIAQFLITYTTGLSVFNFLCLFCGELVNFLVLWSTGEFSCFVVNSWIFMVPVIAFMCLSFIFLSISLTSNHVLVFGTLLLCCQIHASV